MIKRILDDKLFASLFKGNTIVLQGARRVGKTALLKEVQNRFPQSVFLDAANPDEALLLTNPDKNALDPIIARTRLLIVDNVQQLPDPGQLIKQISEDFKNLQLITGTSFATVLERNQYLKTIQLYAPGFEEWKAYAISNKLSGIIEERLVYGMNPEVLSATNDMELMLKDLATQVLLKDVLKYRNPRKTNEIQKLLKMLAHQCCSELNYSELADQLGIDIKTAMRYVDLLEDAFIVFRLPSFSQKVKTEITKGRKIYFYDNGIRNALLNQFEAFDLRMDKDLLWENFMVSERMKFNNYHGRNVNMYFWRTIQHQQIDLVEEKDGLFKAFQFKYNPNKRVKVPRTFSRNYPASVQTINKKNFEAFVSL